MTFNTTSSSATVYRIGSNPPSLKSGNFVAKLITALHGHSHLHLVPENLVFNRHSNFCPYSEDICWSQGASSRQKFKGLLTHNHSGNHSDQPKVKTLFRSLVYTCFRGYLHHVRT